MIYNISITIMILWRRVAVFDLGCKQTSRVLPVPSFKAPELTEIKAIQEQKVKARALIKEAEGETARKSKSQPATHRPKEESLYSWPERRNT